MNSAFDRFNSELRAVTKARFAELLLGAALAGDEQWNRTIAALNKHHLTETIVAAPFTKLGWSRERVALERHRLSESGHTDSASDWLSREWLALLKREFDESCVAVLRRLTPDALLECLESLYINEMTGRRVVEHLAGKQVYDLIDNNPNTRRIFADLDRGLETVGRVMDREMAKTSARLDQQLERHVQTTRELLDAQSRADAAETRVKELEESSCCQPAAQGDKAYTLFPHRDCQCNTLSSMVEANCRRYIHDDEHLL